MAKKGVEPYKDQKFEAFLDIIKEKRLKSWVMIADALQVHPNTITNWRRHPKAQEIIASQVANALEQMEKAGSKDWRMWDRKLQMLGVNPAIKIDKKHGLDDPVLKILKRFGLGEEEEMDDREAQIIEGETSEGSP